MITWHGGEPLLMGKEFYRKAWSWTPGPGVRFRHLIQTNLLDLDPEWVDLMAENDVGVGTSVDPFNDSRTCLGGGPQYPRWLNSFLLARRGGLRPSVVFTVTRRHLGRSSEVYAFFRNLRYLAGVPVYVRMNAVYRAGRAGRDPRWQDAVSPEEFGRFLSEIAAAWTRDGKPLPISPLVEWLGSIPPSCEYSGRCHAQFLAVDGAGNAYHCGRFLDGEAHPLGNIVTDPLSRLIDASHPERARMRERAVRLRRGSCRDCPHWPRCGGGCPYLAEACGGDAAGPSSACATVRTFLSDGRLDGTTARA